MRILFVYDELRLDIPNFTGYSHEGLMSLSACLKAAGHDTALLHITRWYSDEEFALRLKEHKPDLIGFSSVSATYPDVRRLLPVARRTFPDTPILYGGVHPTFDPQSSIEIPGVTAVCRGEGEEALVEFVDCLDRGVDPSGVANFWVRRGNQVTKNPVRPLVTNLDSLPKPDVHLFDFANLFSSREHTAPLTASRGCPYMCTYCSNHAQMQQYPNKGDYVRFKSVDRTIEEAHQRLGADPDVDIHYLDFTDDILPLRPLWFREFAERYPKEVGKSFTCNILIPLLTEENVRLLSNAGCGLIVFGLESGSERMRKLMKRPRMTNAEILEKTELLKRHGIKIASYNMVGLPTETTTEILETVQLNARVAPMKMNVFHFQPYPGTEIHKLSVDLGLYDPAQDLHNTWKVGPVLEGTGISDEQVIFLHRFFKPLVLAYRLALRFGYSLDRLDSFISNRVLPRPRLMSALTKGWDRGHRLAKAVYVFGFMRFWSRRNRSH